MKLVQTDSYLLLIDEESEIKDGDYFIKDTPPVYFKPKRFIKKRDIFSPTAKCNKIIAYYPLTEEAKELDLPLLPVTPRNKWGIHETHCCSKHGCKYGDDDCCVELGIAKQRYPCEFCSHEEQEFSLEDIQKAFEAGVAWHVNPNISELDAYTRFIQSLSTQQLPKEFIPEYETPYSDGFTDDRVRRFYGKPVLKTITNSEGKEELVGNYKY